MVKRPDVCVQESEARGLFELQKWGELERNSASVVRRSRSDAHRQAFVSSLNRCSGNTKELLTTCVPLAMGLNSSLKILLCARAERPADITATSTSLCTLVVLRYAGYVMLVAL
jgi:hypothetical protein